MATVRVNLGKNSYDIVIRHGLLKEAGKEIDLNRKVMVVTDSGVPKEYAEAVLSQCKEGYCHVFQAGEANKTLQTVEKILSEMLEHSFTRKDCLVAVGGGVPGDLGGFTAASYMRGIDFYNIPTTVLSQVDSSSGGKTGVNLNSVKNIVGAFYQPKKVLMDPDVFKTLPARQISSGLAEAFKMAACFDKELFNMFLEGNPLERIDEIIEKSVICKKNVVEQDEKEAGLRKVLNFGHTIGHGIESTIIGERALYHGECVALGMVPMCSPEVREKIVAGLKKLGLPVEYELDEDKVCQAVGHDKKAAGSTISTVYVPAPGSFELRDMTVAQLKELLPVINSSQKR